MLTSLVVYDEDGEEMGDFREEPYDLSECDETPEEAPDFTQFFLYCIVVIAVLIAFVWWVLQVAEPMLDRIDAMRVK